MIATRIWLDDSAIAYSWRDDLKQRIEVLERIPYRCIYLANGGVELALVEPA